MSERIGGAGAGAARLGSEGLASGPLALVPVRFRGIVRQGLSFLAVGGAGLLVDVGVFNVLRATVLAPDHVAGGAMWAKAISVSLAIVVNWIGNRTITFRRERRTGARSAVAREAVEFLAASLLGSAVSLLCLGVSHYLLDLRTAADDNVSANVVGLLLGTGLRFALYRLWVFRPGRAARGAADA